MLAPPVVLFLAQTGASAWPRFELANGSIAAFPGKPSLNTAEGAGYQAYDYSYSGKNEAASLILYVYADGNAKRLANWKEPQKQEFLAAIVRLTAEQKGAKISTTNFTKQGNNPILDAQLSGMGGSKITTFCRAIPTKQGVALFLYSHSDAERAAMGIRQFLSGTKL